jgi:hypothetical protein
VVLCNINITQSQSNVDLSLFTFVLKLRFSSFSRRFTDSSCVNWHQGTSVRARVGQFGTAASYRHGQDKLRREFFLKACAWSTIAELGNVIHSLATDLSGCVKRFCGVPSSFYVRVFWSDRLRHRRRAKHLISIILHSIRTVKYGFVQTTTTTMPLKI